MDALAAANTATAAITATDARIDAIEIGQQAIGTQLAQFLTLVIAGGFGGDGSCGGELLEVALAEVTEALVVALTEMDKLFHRNDGGL